MRETDKNKKVNKKFDEERLILIILKLRIVTNPLVGCLLTRMKEDITTTTKKKIRNNIGFFLIEYL